MCTEIIFQMFITCISVAEKLINFTDIRLHRFTWNLQPLWKLIDTAHKHARDRPRMRMSYTELREEFFVLIWISSAQKQVS
jgi:hypothetical protein